MYVYIRVALCGQANSGSGHEKAIDLLFSRVQVEHLL